MWWLIILVAIPLGGFLSSSVQSCGTNDRIRVTHMTLEISVVNVWRPWQLVQLVHWSISQTIHYDIMQTWRTRLGRRGHWDTLSNHSYKLCVWSRWAALRVAVAHLLEAGLSVLGLGVVSDRGRVIQLLRQAGAGRVQRPGDRHRARGRQGPRARQADPRPSRRPFALWTFGTQHASIPRCTPAHSVKFGTDPAPTPTRSATAATIQRIHIQVWWVVLACDVALWRKRVRKAWCKCICNVRHNTHMEPHTTRYGVCCSHTCHSVGTYGYNIVGTHT